MGNQSLEERILFEVEKLINELSIAEASGDALDPSEVLHEAVTNILCSAIFGCRLVYGWLIGAVRKSFLLNISLQMEL